MQTVLVCSYHFQYHKESGDSSDILCEHEMQLCQIILPNYRLLKTTYDMCLPFMYWSICTLESTYCSLEKFFRQQSCLIHSHTMQVHEESRSDWSHLVSAVAVWPDPFSLWGYRLGYSYSIFLKGAWVDCLGVHCLLESIFEFTIQLTWDHGDFKIMEPKQYRQFTRLFSRSSLGTSYIICYCT